MADGLGDEIALTWEILKEICPIAPSDRRKFAECFNFVEKAKLSVDEVFYPAVLSRMRADAEYCYSLNCAFLLAPREKDKQRAFSFRAARWLRQQMPWLALSTEASPGPQDGYDAITGTEREVFDLWYRSLYNESPEASGEGWHSPIVPKRPDWRELAQELRVAIESFDEADVNRAASIISLAQDLLGACAEYQNEQVARDGAMIRTRRESLQEMLSPLYATELGKLLMEYLAQIERQESLVDFEMATEGLLEAVQVMSAAAKDSRKAAELEVAMSVDLTHSRAERRRALDDAEAAENAESAARAVVEDLISVALGHLAQSPSSDSDDGAGITTMDQQPDDDAPCLACDSEQSAPSEVSLADGATVVASNEKPTDDPSQFPASETNGSEIPPLLPTQVVEASTYAAVERLTAVLQAEREPIESPLLNDTATKVEDGDSSTIWTAQTSLDALLAVYLGSGEWALAWHLAELAEEAGHSSPVPPILLKALAAGRAVVDPFDHSTQIMGEILAAGMSAVEAIDGDGSAISLRARKLALAALLRPALMARDTNAREHLANLSLVNGLASYGRVVSLLSGLRHDLQPSIAELTDLAGGEKERRLPQVVDEIEDWLPRARAAQSMHAPSNTVLHNILGPQGRLGQLFEAALRDNLAPLEAERNFLHRLAGDKGLAADMVAAEEKELNRPKRDAIRGMALDWICRKLCEGAEMLLRWRAAKRDDTNADDRSRDDLRRYVNNLRKELERVNDEGTEGEGFDAAVQSCLSRAVADLLTILDGQAGTASQMRVSEALEGPLLRLPGICQPYAPANDAAYADETRRQRAALFAALCTPGELPQDDVDALLGHIADRAILPARRLLARIERSGKLSEADLGARHQEMEEVLHAAIRETETEMTSLRHELEPLQSIDLSTSQQIQAWLDRFAAISSSLKASSGRGSKLSTPVMPMNDGQRVPDIPADFPQMKALLGQVRDLRDSVRGRIMADQATRLGEIAIRHSGDGNDSLAQEARHVADTLSERDLLTVEDIIIRLQDGQSLALRADEQEDGFSDFYPRFVSDLATTETDVAAIKLAMAEGRRLGALDYSLLEESNRKRSEQLFENWRQLSNAMKSNRGDLKHALLQFMERLGFTSVSITQENNLSPHLRWMRMLSDELVSQHWFFPPVFGSEARGSYPVFLAHRNIEDAQLVAELAKVGRDAPCILLVFDRMTKARREGFALAMRRAKQTVLLVDEAQVLYLTGNTSWMERLFACAVPFGYIQPYTTSAGNIPSEMFFGRKAEITKIESASTDGCLVYGGRQLGKSALLHHVRKRFNKPQIGRHAYYLKIDEFGGQVQPASQIWSEIHRALLVDNILPKGSDEADDISQGISAWLSRGGERRILLLIDEADMFLASEARSGFPNLNRLKDMMEATSRRFKVVFAGLHNVRRMAKAPNSPLVHLSEPICIGPLNTSAESSLQARRLVMEPMKSAGFDYASPDLVHALLTRVNYYPSLIQVFCKALLEGMSNQSRPQGRGPRWILQKEDLFEGSSAQDINAQIRERFQWTLNLDPRYELIAKVLARHRLVDSEREGGVMTPDALAREVEDFWPKGYETLSAEDFRAFLEEMVDLGVLIRLGREKRFYSLRGAQVAQMLGQLDQLEIEILSIAEKEPRVDYDPSLYHRRVRPDQIDRRSPLSDSDLASLYDTRRPGLRFLVAPPAIWGGDTARIITDLAAEWTDADGRLLSELMRIGAGDDELRHLIERGNGRRVLVIPATGKMPVKWVSWLAAHSQIGKGQVIPIFIGDHDQISQLLPHREAGITVQVFRARPWERAMLRAWLAEMSLQTLDTPECREALLEVSGGSPLLLTRLKAGLEGLVAQGRRENAVEGIRKLGEGFRFLPGEIGLPERLVPVFCMAAELDKGQGTERLMLIELLVLDGNSQAEHELALLEKLGLFTRHSTEMVRLSPLGMLVFNTCERPQTTVRS